MELAAANLAVTQQLATLRVQHERTLTDLALAQVGGGGGQGCSLGSLTIQQGGCSCDLVGGWFLSIECRNSHVP